MSTVEYFKAGHFVAHPVYGPARVTGVEQVEVAGERFNVLAMAPMTGRSGVIKIPLGKLRCTGVRRVSPQEAFDAAYEADGAQKVPPSPFVWKRNHADYCRKGGLAKAARYRER